METRIDHITGGIYRISSWEDSYGPTVVEEAEAVEY